MNDYKKIELLKEKIRIVTAFIVKDKYDVVITIQEKRKILWFIPIWRTKYKEYVKMTYGNTDLIEKLTKYRSWILHNISQNDFDLDKIKKTVYENYHKFRFQNNKKDYLKFNKDSAEENFIL